MLARDLHQLTQQLVRIHRTGRIVGIDHHQGTGTFGDLAADIVQVRQPAGTFIAQVVAWRATGQTDPRGPQRIVGCRHQHFVAIVEQTLHRHYDQFRHTIANENVIHAHAADILLLGVMHDGLAGCKQPARIGVARGRRQIGNDVLADFIRCSKAKRRQVADVELEDALALLLHLLGACHHRATNVVADIGQLGRFAYRAQRAGSQYNWCDGWLHDLSLQCKRYNVTGHLARFPTTAYETSRRPYQYPPCIHRLW